MKKAIITTIAVLGLVLFYGISSNNAYATDAIQKWWFKAPSSGISSPAIGSDGTIYVGSWRTIMYLRKFGIYNIF